MLSFGEKTAKIGPEDPEIICLREIVKNDAEEKKKEINASKIYSPSGKFAERVKQKITSFHSYMLYQS